MNRWNSTPDCRNPFAYSNSNDTSDWKILGNGTDETITNFDDLEVGRWYRFWVKAKDLDGDACADQQR